MNKANISILNPAANAPGQPIAHGGDISAAEAIFGKPENGWLDLSTGINPNPYPLANIPPDFLSQLPGNDHMESLLGQARKYYQVAKDAHIVAAPGSQALVGLVPKIFSPNSVSILGPTYAEHEKCWLKAGHSLMDAGSTCEQAAGVANYAVVVNPNNPTGAIHQVDGLLGLAHEMHARGGALVVDEAFCDVAPELSLCPHADKPGLVILRSFGKFFGLGGVRLGFAITNSRTAELIESALGPWAVSGPAMWAGISAFGDEKWIAQNKKQLRGNSEKLNELLKTSGMEIIGGTDLFCLAAHPNANEIYERLGRKGILTRPFVENPNWLRFGSPANEDAFARLERALNS